MHELNADHVTEATPRCTRAEADCVASPLRPGGAPARQDTLRSSGGSLAAGTVPATALDEELVPLLAVSTKKETRSRQVQIDLAHFASHSTCTPIRTLQCN